ncbi:GNAT family N-acetyltransferase [Chitinimonas sp. BJYL2]|uniref:GNAT family N-acetyltransferase n=1 Tax=Chitinimonas sp. BJYL2 TaxID=2976696 RepID=UPI0022B3DEB2|nr:GNAT family N-acetyltransferase [Chitinimonas sp. BJYL2]
MSVSLVPMTAEHYADFMARSRQDYANSNIKAGRWPAEGALERAHAQTREMLPQGQATPNHHFLDVHDAEGDAVGVLWFALNPGPGGPQAWIYEIAIAESRRGQGLGRATMLAFEQAARALGAQTLGLNVFAYNTAAESLYRSLGYLPVATQMSKPALA